MARVPQMKNPDSHLEEVINLLKRKSPPEVNDLVFESGFDAGGEPAIWVWVIFEDTALETKWTFDNRSQIRDSIVQELRDAGIPDWTYVRFRTASEQSELCREALN